MNVNKICIIACVNNPVFWEECMYYLQRLYVPEGYELEVLSIQNAESMTSGYNQAMAKSDAKYKIYMHQDVFIVNRYFLAEMLDIFKLDRKIGMIGVVGSVDFPEDGVMWHTGRVGTLYCRNASLSGATSLSEYTDLCNEYVRPDLQQLRDVKLVDGLLMATQYDLPWLEEPFDGWDFYDASHSVQLLCAGYRNVVPLLGKPICVHDDGILNLDNYEGYRLRFVEWLKTQNMH